MGRLSDGVVRGHPRDGRRDFWNCSDCGNAKVWTDWIFTNQVPSMDLPLYLSPLKVLIFVIEIAGLLIKHLILSVRLLANMVAGHLVLLGIMGLIVSSARRLPPCGLQ